MAIRNDGTEARRQRILRLKRHIMKFQGDDVPEKRLLSMFCEETGLTMARVSEMLELLLDSGSIVREGEIGKSKLVARARARKRRQLMGHLDAVLEVAFDKYSNPRTANGQRQGWARVIVNSVAVGDGLLKSAELELIEERLRVLEEAGKK